MKNVWFLEGNCEQGEFVCPDGACIDATWKCDGVKDCTGGEDENFCVNGKIFACLVQLFLRFNGIPTSEYCQSKRSFNVLSV